LTSVGLLRAMCISRLTFIQMRIDMNKFFICYLKIVFLIFVSLMTISCSSFKTEIVQQKNQKWRLSSVSVYPKGESWSVQGMLSSYSSFGLPEGYVLISITSVEGTIVETKQVRYRKFMGTSRWSRNRFGRAFFYSEFDFIPKDAFVTAELIAVSGLME